MVYFSALKQGLVVFQVKKLDSSRKTSGFDGPASVTHCVKLP
jgi:hypothetical protein